MGYDWVLSSFARVQVSVYTTFSRQLCDQTQHHESYHTLSHFFPKRIRVCADVHAFLISSGLINNLINVNL